MPPEQFQRLSEALGVTKAALTSFFKILEQQEVPPEDLDAKLREIATHYKALLERIRTLSADDPHIAHLRDTAETAIQEGNFDRAEQLLNEASAKDLEVAQELQDIMTKRLLAAAEAKATNGALKMTQLAYAEAANYYHQATELVEQMPVGSEEHLARFLNDWGAASYDAGDYRDAERPLKRALAERVLGPEHPDVATFLGNYAALLRATNRNGDVLDLDIMFQTGRPNS
jgi:tetratricopeptide (TPR) repeat protein